MRGEPVFWLGICAVTLSALKEVSHKLIFCANDIDRSSKEKQRESLLNRAQKKIVAWWFFLALLIIAIVYFQQTISGMFENISKGVWVPLVLIVSFFVGFVFRPITNTAHQSKTLSEDFPDLVSRPLVVIYYGIVCAVSILMASKSARTGVNPFEGMGVLHIFLGFLILGVPFIVYTEYSKFHEAGPNN